MATPARPYDLVVWGATGFTGRLVAEHLSKTYTGPTSNHGLRWALAGRNQAKLEAVRASLGPNAAGVPIAVADPTAPGQLDAVVGSASVVLAMAGPYSLYGTPVVDACVRMKSDYCDITGESPFMRKAIDTHNDTAKAQGTAVVHTVGYDSVPWDLGALLAVKHLRSQPGVGANAAISVEGFVGSTMGGFSGGTIASMLNMMNEPGDRSALRDSKALNPSGGERGAGPQSGPAYSPVAKRWTMPSIMAAVNEKVVNRSAALQPELYGPGFSYVESTLAPHAVGAYIGTGAMALGALSIAFPPTRWLLQHTVLPAPGQGPGTHMRETGHFAALFVGTAAGTNARSFVRIARKNADPGYKATSIMAAEAALCLALQRDACPGARGVTTPAVALGDVLVNRLKAQGFEIDVRSFGDDETVPDA
jgi:short subunit dehydrogenase-like uncharacterized protein